jgi:hypothetical protein
VYQTRGLTSLTGALRRGSALSTSSARLRVSEVGAGIQVGSDLWGGADRGRRRRGRLGAAVGHRTGPGDPAPPRPWRPRHPSLAGARRHHQPHPAPAACPPRSPHRRPAPRWPRGLPRPRQRRRAGRPDPLARPPSSHRPTRHLAPRPPSSGSLTHVWVTRRLRGEGSTKRGCGGRCCGRGKEPVSLSWWGELRPVEARCWRAMGAVGGAAGSTRRRCGRHQPRGRPRGGGLGADDGGGWSRVGPGEPARGERGCGGCRRWRGATSRRGRGRGGGVRLPQAGAGRVVRRRSAAGAAGVASPARW